jgi:hypothetical protein
LTQGPVSCFRVLLQRLVRVSGTSAAPPSRMTTDITAERGPCACDWFVAFHDPRVPRGRRRGIPSSCMSVATAPTAPLFSVLAYSDAAWTVTGSPPACLISPTVHLNLRIPEAWVGGSREVPCQHTTAAGERMRGDRAGVAAQGRRLRLISFSHTGGPRQHGSRPILGCRARLARNVGGPSAP